MITITLPAWLIWVLIVMAGISLATNITIIVLRTIQARLTKKLISINERSEQLGKRVTSLKEGRK